MLLSIINQIKTGIVKNVVPFGTNNLPNVPYVVVKEEPGDIGTTYRINAHFPPGAVLDLRKYVRNDLLVLLDSFKTTSGTNTNILNSLNEIGQIVANNDDGSISQDRLFIMTDRYF
ncbi:MAG: hypothetical protein OEV44_01355 [Spirochaetota bacterium]|nr:hypothetical protein [Spirochaetota bacterium]